MAVLTKDEVLQVAYVFRLHAEHFQQSDWIYTRKTEIKHIRYADAYKGYNHPVKRVQRTVKNLLTRDLSWKKIFRDDEKEMSFKEKLYRKALSVRASILVGLRTDSHRPDGVLDDGNIITHWEETGEYLQFVQPSVGSLLADFLMKDPTHPSARAIAGEMKRILDAYALRLGEEPSWPTIEWVTVSRKRYPVIINDWTDDLGYLDLNVLNVGRTKAASKASIKEAVAVVVKTREEEAETSF